MKKLPPHILADNRAAKFHYEILDDFEAGIILTGIETKSLRTNSTKLSGSFIKIKNDGAWLTGFKIPIYRYAKGQTHAELRDKKLLLSSRELAKIQKNLNEKGVACIPLNLHLANNKIKIKIALGKGKKKWDKRQIIKQRDVTRDLQRETKGS
jgi:SsrA-binding protein